MKDFKDVLFFEGFILNWLMHYTYILPEHLWKKDFYAPTWSVEYGSRELSFLFVHRDECSIFSEEYARRGKYTHTCTFNFTLDIEKKIFKINLFNGVNKIELCSSTYGDLFDGENKNIIVKLINDWVTCGGVVTPPTKCFICDCVIEGHGHNGEPYVPGRVCDSCLPKVLSKRMRLAKESKDGLKQEN